MNKYLDATRALRSDWRQDFFYAVHHGRLENVVVCGDDDGCGGGGGGGSSDGDGDGVSI